MATSDLVHGTVFRLNATGWWEMGWGFRFVDRGAWWWQVAAGSGQVVAAGGWRVWPAGSVCGWEMAGGGWRIVVLGC